MQIICKLAQSKVLKIQYMTKVINVKKGLNIPLLGEADKTITELSSKKFAIKPPDFIGVFPKLLVQPGDKVKAGSPLFHDKERENLIFTSPVSGTVSEIHRGEKRLLLEVRIEADGKDEFIDFGKANPELLSREAIINKLITSGVWPMIRQRPYSIIANPVDDPKAIFIPAFDTSPLAPDYDFVVHGHGEEFQMGLNVLSKLTSGKIHLNLHAEAGHSKVFTNSRGVQINEFSGPHPVGNVSTQIAHISPINKGDIIWYLRPQEVITIGRLFIEGRYNSMRLVALTGPEVKNPRYFKTRTGTCIEKMIQDNIKLDNVRYISGNVLTGKKIEDDGYLGFYDSQVSVVREGNYHEFLGWGLPRLNKFSFSKTYLSWLMGKKKYNLDTNLNGGVRAFVMTGEFEKVFGWDIYPLQLIKATIIEDIDLMEKLGIYEVDEEDFALCEFIDTSKTNIQAIIRNGLDLIRKEMS